MSETLEANTQQNTPSAAELDSQIAADEAARVEPETEPVADPEPVVDAEPAQHEESDFEKRISRLAYEKRTAEKQARQLQEQLDRAVGKTPPLSTDEQTREMIQREAQQIAAQELYNSRANAIHAEGVKAFPDFEQRLQGLRDIGGISPALVEAADEVGEAHKLIHYLAKNLDEAERIMKLPPHRLGAALGKLSSKMVTPPKPTQAPAPIRPINGGSVESNDPDKMPLEKYIEMETERWANRRFRR